MQGASARPKKSYALGMNWSITDKASLSLDVVGKSSFYYSDSHNNHLNHIRNEYKF